MKNLCITDTFGNVRPGRATIEAIERILDGKDTDNLATIRIDDGEVVTTLLTDGERSTLRGEMAKRRAAALVDALNASLALHRATDGIPGVRPPYGSIVIDLGESPWAEPVALDWAHERGLTVTNEPPPSKPGKWTRRAEITLRPESWSPTIAKLEWRTIEWSASEMVAHDADEVGRDDEAKSIRNAESPATAAQELPF